MNRDDLVNTLVRVGRQEILEHTFASLDRSTLPPDVQRRWKLRVTRNPSMTIWEALSRLPPHDRAILITTLLRQHAPGALRAGMSREELDAWAAERGLEWALAAPLTVLPNHFYTSFLPHRNIADLVVGTRDGSMAHWYDGTVFAEHAIQWLADLEVQARSRREAERAELPALSVDPGGALSPVWRRFHDRYVHLSKTTLMTLWAHTRMNVVLDPPTLQLSVEGRGVVEVPLESDPPTLRWPAEELAVCHMVLRVLTTPCELRDQLAKAIGSPRWERDLEYLDHAMEADREIDPSKPHVAWEVDERNGAIELFPSLCRVTKAGKLQGRRVSADELVGLRGLQGIDAQVVSLLHAWRRPPREVVLEALELLSGHPRVILQGSGGQTPIPVRSGTLLMTLRNTDEGVTCDFSVAGRSLTLAELRAALSGSDAAGGRAAIVRERELLVARCTVDQRELALAWATRSPTLPADALPRLMAMLPRLQQRMPLRLSDELRGREVRGDGRPIFRLRMEGESLVISASIQPLPDAHEQAPGEPPETLHVIRDGQPRYHVRDLRDEPARVMAALEELGVPESARQGPWLWAIDDQEQALDVVRAIDPGRHRVEMDAHLPMVVDAETKHLKLILEGSGHDWFGASGRLQIAQINVDLHEIAEAIHADRIYVPIGKNRFVRLEATLAARLRGLGAGDGKGELRVGAVHAALLEAVEEDGGLVEGPAAWRETATRLRDARDAEFALPAGLNAELRPYQRDGFTWLARQAAWAPGAVLADDMGLGKTVQTITLLLHRREDGPALVVAPTSVVFNWAAELARFAPGLRVRSYHGPGRAPLLDGLRAGDVLLTSYGTMLRDAEILAERTFGTLVLDESQALKNPEAQRTKAARTLKAGFRVALSGTPVENHAIELWSLFSILVPGLLGSMPVFRRRFLGAREQDKRRGLADLVGPFMLRRTKKQVAPELPERQEVTRLLELDEDHQAAYELEVKKSLDRIATAGDRARFVTGQELMRLRQFACDPRLADPGSPWRGPKVRWVRRNVEAVLEAGEQALVFSTYVKLLELVRTELEADGVRIAWLTGDTPVAQRQAEVARFQRGEADVFLLSLKAGGTGLNLTAASYVFILDPWFNPAAEDQAADRAHRIGQDKKVTIYRGVARSTVEERILDLHAEKRALYDMLMSGAGSTEVLSPADLLLLLSGGTPAPKLRVAPEETAPAPPPALRVVEPDEVVEELVAEDTPAEDTDLDGWMAWARARLEAAPLAPSSVKIYVRAVEWFVAWCADQGYAASEVQRAITAYREVAASGEVPRSRMLPLNAAWTKLYP
ncbi:MAG: DEAD/DEAH box helicase [Alphaproteobacteria bacterium]|nr:DEAD/DEAH box helicase [Alphaproteobacteria bacterium]MCB9698512.1 DEAD/DEAH box helicase [Alphaproteobacteria bacterium]